MASKGTPHGLEGQLMITLHGGKALKVVQLVGKQDPYCSIECGKQKFKTRTHDNGHTTPQWEQTFCFNLRSNDKEQEFVHFKVKDENTFKDARIGRADIRVTQLVQELNVSKWIQIIDWEDYNKTTGLLNITVEFNGTGLEKVVVPVVKQIPLAEDYGKQSTPAPQPTIIPQQQQQINYASPPPAAIYASPPVMLSNQQNIPYATAMVQQPYIQYAQPPLQMINSAAPPAYQQQQQQQQQAPANDADRLAQLRHFIVEKHKISKFFANKLFKLEDFEIVLICDDSGSMSSRVYDPSDRFAPPRTRWDELKQTVSIVTDIAGLMDESGIDIYFLNRPPIFGIKSTQQIGAAFSDPPSGYTPIRDAITRVFQDKHDILYPQKRLSEMKGDVVTMKDKKLLLIVCTDGQPTTKNGNDDQKALHQFLINRKPLERIFITFSCCTDDDQAIGYLEEWDKDIPNFDVVDDYYTERDQVIKAQGVDFSFSPGDYVVKMLLGSVDSEIDKWDERR